MQELSDILREHAARYPLMEPTDAVKLIYQNEFGGGHMIPNEDVCLSYLHREYAETEHDSNAPLAEAIGNGIVRIYLSALEKDKVEALGKAFIRSANLHTGNMDSFLAKLELLRRLTAEGVFSFDLASLDDYLMAYRSVGYPAVSHSDAYRKAYRPAYRIVLKDFFA